MTTNERMLLQNLHDQIFDINVIVNTVRDALMRVDAGIAEVDDSTFTLRAVNRLFDEALNTTANLVKPEQ